MFLPERWILFFILSALVLFVLFIPELLPKCSCCGKYKPRLLFRLHRAVSISPGYGGSRSVCTRCCREYHISSIKDLDKVLDIRRRLRLESLYEPLGTGTHAKNL